MHRMIWETRNDTLLVCGSSILSFFFFTSKGNNSDMEIFASLLTGAIIKGKNLLPLGANSFL